MKSVGFLQKLKNDGFRITRVRRWLVGFFDSFDLPLTVPDLMDKLRENKLTANKTTLYRELEFLAERGLVSPVSLRDGRMAYESTLGHHHHLVCRVCSKILHVDVEGLEGQFGVVHKWLADRSGFTDVYHDLEFVGVCAECVS